MDEQETTYDTTPSHEQLSFAAGLRASYLAYISVGFTPNQAMALTRVELTGSYNSPQD